jgi:hypothetical protein
MKKRLLSILFLGLGLSVEAQFNQSNEPQIGTSVLLYVCDSTYTDAANIKGSNVTWDFSDIAAEAQNTTKTMTVATANNSDFSGASYVSEIPGFLSTYWSSSSSNRNSYGFVFSDPSAGDIIISFSGNQEILMNYPFNANGTLTDSYSGTLKNQQMAPNGTACTGSITSSIDGSGTLILAGNNTFTNVLRHKIVESTSATINLQGFYVPATVSRTQYDYYDLSQSSFPIFSYISISYDAYIVSGNVKLVLSTIDPNTTTPTTPPSTAGIKDVNQVQFNMYPNPANDSFNIDVEGGDADVQIIDPNGREMFNTKLTSGHQIIDISMLDSGVYFVKVVVNGKVSIQRLVIQ